MTSPAVKLCLERMSHHLEKILTLLSQDKIAESKTEARDLHTEAATLRSLLEVEHGN